MTYIDTRWTLANSSCVLLGTHELFAKLAKTITLNGLHIHFYNKPVIFNPDLITFADR